MALAPGTAVGSYEVLSLLGSGGMASVYKARHTILGSVHALKVLRPDLVAHAGIRKRFLDEGRVQAQLSHPGVVRVTDLVSEPGVAGLVMDFLTGVPLDEELEREVPTIHQAVFWMLQILGTMEHAHSQGVVHRDLKPSNLFVSEEGGRRHMRVLDFGIAKILGKARTLTQETMGTYAYMSPEQIRDASAVDARSDIFALGAVLFELVTGAPAFDGPTDYGLMQRVVAGDHTSMSGFDLPPALEQAIGRALRVDPDDRFQSCLAFATAIESCAHRDDRAELRGWAEEPPAPAVLPDVSIQSTFTGFDLSGAQFDDLEIVPSHLTDAGVTEEEELVAPETLGKPMVRHPQASATRSERHEMVVRAAGVAQVLVGILNVFVLWAALCWGLPFVTGELLDLADLPGVFVALSKATALLGCAVFPVGVIEIVTGVRAIARGSASRGAVQRTGFLQIAALGLGGIPSFVVGVGVTGLLLAVRPDPEPQGNTL